MSFNHLYEGRYPLAPVLRSFSCKAEFIIDTENPAPNRAIAEEEFYASLREIERTYPELELADWKVD